jgi:hypothetical protein
MSAIERGGHGLPTTPDKLHADKGYDKRRVHGFLRQARDTARPWWLSPGVAASPRSTRLVVGRARCPPDNPDACLGEGVVTGPAQSEVGFCEALGPADGRFRRIGNSRTRRRWLP